MSANRPEAGRVLSGQASRGQLNGGQPKSGLPESARPESARPESVRPESGRPESAQPDEAATDALQALCASALRLLSAARQTPARLRLAAGAASIEIEWPPPAIAPGPAQDQPAAGEAQHRARAGNEDLGEAGGRDQGAAPCIRAPMVGTFYHAPEPGSAPFVRAGDIVEAGQQVGILEVMKLMTPVQADQRARVLEFLVPDASPVEHGQPLISCACP